MFSHSAILNFIQSNIRSGIDDEVIINHAVEFFPENTLKDAKVDLWAEIYPSSKTAPRRQGDNASARHVKDMIDLLRKCENEELTVPTYVIISPTEVPVIPAVAYHKLASKICALDSTLNFIKEKVTAYDLNFPSLPIPYASPHIESTATVIISKVPTKLDDPSKRAHAINKIPGHEAIHSIKPSGDKLLVQISQSAAKIFSDAVPTVLNSCDVMIQEKKFHGIVKGVPANYEAIIFKKCEGVIDAERLGKSLAVKITFADAVAQSNSLRLGLKVGYESFRVFEFLRPPRCCHNCQSPNHMKTKCDKPTKCSRCAGSHVSSRDSPCVFDPKCANCGGNHASYSLKCRILRDVLSKRVIRK